MLPLTSRIKKSNTSLLHTQLINTYHIELKKLVGGREGSFRKHKAKFGNGMMMDTRSMSGQRLKVSR
jgi:hypothetical protein